MSDRKKSRLSPGHLCGLQSRDTCERELRMSALPAAASALEGYSGEKE